MEIVLVYITFPSPEEASRVGQLLVESKLAACTNRFDSMSSSYFWEGSVQSDREAVLICKTRRELVGELTEKVKQNHSYQVPAILALPVVGGNEDYIRWVYEETREPDKQITG